MSKEQVQSVSELLLSLDSSDLQEAEQVRVAIVHQLNSDRGGAVLCSLVDVYLSSSSCQAVQLLSSVREHLHKPLLDKLNEVVSRPASRLAAVTLLGHMISQQPPWVHHVSRSPLLTSLLRCLKSDSEVLVVVPGVLVLVTLLPMIPQAAKQHIYDFFDVFGRLASWSLKNPGHAHFSHLVHLHAGVYLLFHRLYGMFPCNFISYLRLHYSMKENLDTFHQVVKPMLEQVRVHPELVSGTQDLELEPSRWRRYEVHDILMECSRVSLDPLESSCDSSPLTHLDITHSHIGSPVSVSSPDHLQVCTPVHSMRLNVLADDVTWSPSSECGLSTPPPETVTVSPAHPWSRADSVSGTKNPSPAAARSTNETQDGGRAPEDKQVKQHPIRKGEDSDRNDVTSEDRPRLPSSSLPALLTSTPAPPASDIPPPPCSVSLCLTPPHPSNATLSLEEGGPAPSYDFLFELALPRAAMLFLKRKAQEAQEKTAQVAQTSASPLDLLDQLIAHGHHTHASISNRFPACSKWLDGSHCGVSDPGEELQAARGQLLLVHTQLQYERFKRQQHAIRNRRLLRRVISAAALEEQSVAMQAQLAIQDQEIRSLKSSLDEEQRRYAGLRQDALGQQLRTHVQHLEQQQKEQEEEHLKLRSQLQECQSRLRDLEEELQRANHKACNAEHRLSQLSLKLSGSDKLHQQMFLQNQQLLLLRETNKTLTEQLEVPHQRSFTETSLLQGILGREYQSLKEAELQQRQKLEAANHRATDLENQLAKKEQLIADQKKLLDDTKRRSREELLACEGRGGALRRIVQTLQSEMLELYSHLDALSRPDHGTPATQDDHKPRPSSSVEVVNGVVTHLAASPRLLPPVSTSPCSLSPMESPLAVGSFLEQRAWQCFRPPPPSQEEEEEAEQEVEELQSGSPLLGQEAEAILLAGSPPTQDSVLSPHGSEAPPPSEGADLSLAVRQRRRELSIMDYDEMAPEL
ncbi:TSC complex subunit 1a [Nerophis ophidion]|uniref:TSC complex subunit 1a n=1 Tax=Nerophis ophidion TaxID=159077 RepID=UPI002AE077F1|nr:TSC complex subunit 1a [Nerophis ophidion]